MHWIDYLIVGAYLIGLLLMGYRFRHNRNPKDYFLAGRTIGWKPLTLSIMATQLSAISFVSAPAFVGLREGGGLIWLSYELALPLAMLFLMWRLMPMLHGAGVVSIYDYLERRFDRSSRLLISLVFQISRSFATGIMIYAASIILQGTLGLPVWQSILFIAVITVVYSLQGGMKAVVYGDALQMVLIIFGAVICLIWGLHHIGGIEEVFTHVAPERLQVLRFDSYGFDGQGFGFLPMLFGGFVLYAAYYGCDQSEAQRALAAQNTPELRKMLLSAGLLRFPITCLYCAAGLVIGTLALKTPEFLAQIPPDKPDWMMPIFIVSYLPTGLVGILLVAILAAAMSSLSSAVNSLSAVTLEDFVRYSGKTLSEQQYLQAGKFVGVFWGLITVFLSFHAGDIAPTVIEAINKIGSVFYGPILATFILSISSKRVMALHVNIGLISGVATNIALWLFFDNVFWFWWNLSGCVVALLIAMLCAYCLPKELEQSWSHRQEQGKNNAPPMKYVILLGGWFVFILLICYLISHFGG